MACFPDAGEPESADVDTYGTWAAAQTGRELRSGVWRNIAKGVIVSIEATVRALDGTDRVRGQPLDMVLGPCVVADAPTTLTVWNIEDSMHPTSRQDCNE